MQIRMIAVLALLPMAAIASAGEPDVLASLPRHIALNEHQHVSGQPSVEAIARLKSVGVTALIDLRPDAERPDLDEKAEAAKAGLRYEALPISGAADLTRENVEAFDALLKKTEGENVLMHCASGNRVGALMALRARWLDGRSAEEALAIGKAAGLTGLAPAVEQLLK